MQADEGKGGIKPEVNQSDCKDRGGSSCSVTSWNGDAPERVKRASVSTDTNKISVQHRR